MKVSISQVAAWIEAEILGPTHTKIEGVAKIEEARAGQLAFLANPKYEPHLYQTKASAVIVAKTFKPKEALPESLTLLRVSDPYSSFSKILAHFSTTYPQPEPGISETAFVEDSAVFGEDVYVGPFAYIGHGVKVGKGVKIYPFAYLGDQVQVGDDSIIYPHVTLYRGTEIGKNCMIHAGARLGAEGFGFAPQADGSYQKVPQTGKVIVADEVEIGANTCIDRATLGATMIQAGAKLDNLIQVAHNVDIGNHSVIAAQTGISGSTQIGKYCMVGGQVGFVGHIQVADRTRVDAQSGVNRSIKDPGQAFRGSPIQAHRQQLKSEVLFRKLESLQNRIHQLEQALANRSA